MLTVGTKNESTRVAWVEKIIKQLPEGLRILDAGAGERQFQELCSHLEYVSQDFDQYDGTGDGSALQMGEWDQSGLDIVSDITAIPEQDNSFDAILCTEVFEHLPDPMKALAEFSRLLRKDGHLILTAPFCSMTHFSPFHFYTGFNRYFYERHLPEHGFEIIEQQANGNYFEYLAQEIRRIPGMAQGYSNQRLSEAELSGLGLCLSTLERLSRMDRGSNEMQSFGYHVYALKKVEGHLGRE